MCDTTSDKKCIRQGVIILEGSKESIQEIFIFLFVCGYSVDYDFLLFVD